jgi:signal transduction histidine kinase
MSPFALSGLLTCITSLAFGCFVYLKDKTRLLNRLWFVFTISVAAWGLGGLAIGLAADPATSLWAWRLAFAGGVVWIPILFYHFVCVFGELERTRLLRINYVTGLCLFPLFFTDLMFPTVRLAFPAFYYSRPGLLFPAFFLWWVGLVVFAHYELLKEHNRVSGQRRNQIRYFFLATAVGYSGGSLDYLPIFGMDIYPYGNFAVVLYPAIMTYPILRYRLMDITVAMEKGIMFLLLATIVAVPSYPVMLVLQKAYFGQVSGSFSLALLCLFTLIVLAVSRVKAETQSAVVRTLFKARYDMYETLSAFSQALVTILDLRSLTEEIVRTLTNVIGIRTVSLYLFDQEKDLYVLAASHGLGPDQVRAMKRGAGEGLPYHLERSREILVREELEKAAAPETRAIVTTLAEMRSEVCIPLVNKDRLIGFCNLGARRDAGMYSAEDLNLLTTLARNAAIALDNARLYEDLRRSQILMQRTDRLRSLETVAGGFAHEVRNPLTSIKTFVQLAPMRTDDQEFMGAFSKVVAEDVSRIERLIQEILDYARYMEPKFSEEDLNDIAASCLYFVEVKAESKAIAIEKRLAGDLPTVLLDRQQIKQVLLNLFLNAMEAMPERGGRLSVRTHRLSKPNGEAWVQIEVADTGTGIAAKDLEHIFDPFYTTKHESGEREGTGLGLSIVHQIVQEHHGYIEVESTAGRGTTFFVNLPADPRKAVRRTEAQEHEKANPVGG